MSSSEIGVGADAGKCAGTNCTVQNGEGEHSEECMAEHASELATGDKLSGDWVHKKSGRTYYRVRPCKLKDVNTGKWTPCVAYSDADGAEYVRVLWNFLANFVKAPSQSEQHLAALSASQMYEEGRYSATEGAYELAKALGEIETPPDPAIVNAIKFENVDGEITIHDFTADQWWVKELDGIVEQFHTARGQMEPDQVRAIAVVKHLLKLISELPKPMPRTETKPVFSDPRDVPALAVKQLPGTPKNHASVVDMQTGKVLGHFYLKG